MKKRTLHQQYEKAMGYWIMIQRGAMRCSDAKLRRLERRILELQKQIEREHAQAQAA